MINIGAPVLGCLEAGMEQDAFIKRCQEDPVFFCRQVLGVAPWDKQQEIMYSVRDHRQTCVVSANGMGKSFITAATVAWFLFTRENSVVLTTAPTWRQVVSVLWAELGKMHMMARIPLGGELTSGKLQLGPKWYALGLPSSEEVRFQGFREKNLLICFDEAAGIDPCIYTAAQGCLTLDQHRFLIIGNPTSPSGVFYDASKSAAWNTIHLSALNAPSEKYPYLPSRSWCEARKLEWGESSPMYVARVLGRFPEEGEDTLLPLSWLNAAVKRYDDKPSKELLVSDHVYLGTDVARYGMDKSVCCVYQPNKVVHLKKLQGKDTTAVTRMCSAEAVSVGNRLVQITVDDTGVGGGVTDQLRMQGYPTVGVNFAQKSTNPRFFRKLKDELMWNVRLHLQAGDIALPPDDELIGQLSSLKYKADQATGLIEIEDKEEMRKRGLKSPDCAWALALALWGSKKIRALPRTVQGARAQERSRSREIERWY